MSIPVRYVVLCRALADLAAKNGDSALFDTREHEQYTLYNKEVNKSRNAELVELWGLGFGMHHAGMLRADRSLTERLFAAVSSAGTDFSNISKTPILQP